jgi:hypothetical protein
MFQAPGPMPDQALPSEEALPAPQTTPQRTTAPPAKASSSMLPNRNRRQAHAVQQASAETPWEKYLGIGGDFE